MHQARRCSITAASVALTLVFILELPAAPRAEAQSRTEEIDASYLWDGGAVPFVWGTALATWAVHRYVPARTTPFLFPQDEGGATSERHNELPGEVVTVAAALFGGTIALGGDDSRWFHAKGMAQTIATTTFLTGVAKVSFGRHRPDYDPTLGTQDGHRSFPSGHSSQALAAATYFGLYLRTHGFDRWREPGTLPWWEVAAYGALATAAIAVPVERVMHKRHHATDALAGSLLGAATSGAFFYFQERRYRKIKAGQYESEPTGPMIAPSFDNPGVELMWQF